MSLIKCSECGKEISDKAITCPSCGNPLAPVTTSTPANGKVEIEMTNKKWKKRFILAMFIFILAWIAMAKSFLLGFFLLFIAFCVAITARIGAWWTNG